MSSESPFQPARGKNQKVTASTTSAIITCGAGNHALRVVNQGAVLVIEKPLDHDSVAYLADSTTTLMHFQPGESSS